MILSEADELLAELQRAWVAATPLGDAADDGINHVPAKRVRELYAALWAAYDGLERHMRWWGIPPTQWQPQLLKVHEGPGTRFEVPESTVQRMADVIEHGLADVIPAPHTAAQVAARALRDELVREHEQRIAMIQAYVAQQMTEAAARGYVMEERDARSELPERHWPDPATETLVRRGKSGHTLCELPIKAGGFCGLLIGHPGECDW